MNLEVEATKFALKSNDLKFAVLGNCQMGHVTRCLQAFVGGEWPTNEWVNLDVLNSMVDGRRDLNEYFARYDKVFIQPLTWNYIESHYRHHRHKVVLYPNVEFFGYHPDSVYVDVGVPYNHLVGPCGHYQSTIALLAWKCGLSASDALKLYTRTTYSRLGFFDYWKIARDLLLGEGERAGLPLQDFVERWSRSGCFMHSINHPKLFVIADVVLALLRREGIATLADDTSIRFVRDYLADSVVWPVYPEIAERFGVAGSYTFKLSSPHIQSDQPILTLGLKEFVELSYAAFSAHAPDSLLCSRLDLPAYRQLMEELRTSRVPHESSASSVGEATPAKTRPAGQMSAEIAESVDRAVAEEARMLFRPASPFW